MEMHAIKKTALLLALTCSLSGCDSGGGGGGKSAYSNPGRSGSGPGTIVRNDGSQSIFSNRWSHDNGDGGVMVFTFTGTRATATNYCRQGLIASIEVSARVDQSTVQLLESARKRVDQNGAFCEVFSSAGPAVSYQIQNGRLILAGDTLEPY